MRRLWELPPTRRDLAGAGARRDRAGRGARGRAASRWCGSSPPTRSSRSPTPSASPPALRRAELVVVQDAYHPTETGALAHVVAARRRSGRRRTATMTNSERARVARAARARPARRGAARLGDLRPRRPRARPRATRSRGARAAEVYAEYVATTEGRLCDQTGISHDAAAARGRAAVAVPGPARRATPPGTERLYASRRFADRRRPRAAGADAARRARRRARRRLPAAC